MRRKEEPYDREETRGNCRTGNCCEDDDFEDALNNAGGAAWHLRKVFYLHDSHVTPQLERERMTTKEIIKKFVLTR